MHSLTPNQLDAIQALSSGRSATAAADAIGIHRTTIHHWCRTIPEFRHHLEAAKQARIDLIRDQMHELTFPAFSLLKQTLNDESASPALRIRTALAILKFAATPEKLPTAKSASTEMLFESAYEAGFKAGRESAPESAIHHNSSLSSPDESEVLPDGTQPAQPHQTPRNAECPCGSKLKFKRCCGRNAPPVLTRAA